MNKDFACRGRGKQIQKGLPKSRCRRMYLVCSITLLWVGLISYRLASLQITHPIIWKDRALKQHLSTLVVHSERGSIYDRNDRLLAVSVPSGSIYARPHKIKDKEQVADQLAELLEISSEDILSKLERPAPFVWLARQIPTVTAKQVRSLKIPGVNYSHEAKRYYPFKEVASTIIGRVGVDGNGLSGIEAAFDSRLHTPNVKRKVVRDAHGALLEDVKNLHNIGVFQPPTGGSLRLTLDAEIQRVMESELETARVEYQARNMIGIMVDPDNGEILGLSHGKGVNFNRPSLSNANALKNPVVEAVFEPGSILKPVVAAVAIEEGLVHAGETIDCEKGRLRFGRHTIKDVHPLERVSFRDVVVQSSNIGMTKVGARLGAERLHGALKSFGFGERTKIGLYGESGGILRAPSRWAEVDIATHSFGQGVAVTPLQMVRAFSALVNGGELPDLRLIYDSKPSVKTRILSRSTSEDVRSMLVDVVSSKHGTGKRAAIDGVVVGGKTGTAQRARDDGRGYEPGSYVASFIGFVDSKSLGLERDLVLLVSVDRPDAHSIYGGTLAGPVFKRIMQRSIHLLQRRNDLLSRSKERLQSVGQLPARSGSRGVRKGAHYSDA